MVLAGDTVFAFRACIWSLAVPGNTAKGRMIVVIVWANTIGSQFAVTVWVGLANVAIGTTESWIITGIFSSSLVFARKFRTKRGLTCNFCIDASLGRRTSAPRLTSNRDARVLGFIIRGSFGTAHSTITVGMRATPHVFAHIVHRRMILAGELRAGTSDTCNLVVVDAHLVARAGGGRSTIDFNTFTCNIIVLVAMSTGLAHKLEARRCDANNIVVVDTH